MNKILFFKHIPNWDLFYGIAFFLGGIFCCWLGLTVLVPYVKLLLSKDKTYILLTDTHLVLRESNECILWKAIKKIHLEDYYSGSRKFRQHHQELYFYTNIPLDELQTELCNDEDIPEEELFYASITFNYLASPKSDKNDFFSKIEEFCDRATLNNSCSAREFEFFSKIREFYNGPIVKEYAHNYFKLLTKTSDGTLVWDKVVPTS